MASTRRKPMTAMKAREEDAVRMRMFLEFREENAKDMEREAQGDW